MLEPRSVILPCVFDIVACRSVIVHGVCCTLEFQGVIPRCVYFLCYVHDTLEFRGVILPCVFTFLGPEVSFHDVFLRSCLKMHVRFLSLEFSLRSVRGQFQVSLGSIWDRSGLTWDQFGISLGSFSYQFWDPVGQSAG